MARPVVPAPSSRVPANSPRRGWRVAAGVLAAVVALLAALAWISFRAFEDGGATRNVGVAANVYAMRQAIEAYARDHGGRPPDRARWREELAAPGTTYLVGRRVPGNPWDRRPQAEALLPAPPLVGAAAIAAGATPTPHRADLGPGRPPGGRPADQRTFGALVYDADAATGTWVVYGIGHARGDRAVVIGVATNRRP